MATEIVFGRKDHENIPAWVRNNRKMAEQIRNKVVEENKPKTIQGKNPLQIGSKNLQVVLDENNIQTIEQLEKYIPELKAPMYKKIAKNFIEEQRKVKAETPVETPVETPIE